MLSLCSQVLLQVCANFVFSVCPEHCQVSLLTRQTALGNSAALISKLSNLQKRNSQTNIELKVEQPGHDDSKHLSQMINFPPGQIVISNRQENIVYLIAVLKSNWQCNKALNWPIFHAYIAKRLLVPSSTAKLALPQHRDKPWEVSFLFPIFQGASYSMCHRGGHDRTSAEPSRGQGDFNGVEKPFASGKLSYTS